MYWNKIKYEFYFIQNYFNYWKRFFFYSFDKQYQHFIIYLHITFMLSSDFFLYYGLINDTTCMLF